MSQACARWRGDIGAYIVDALDRAGRARVMRHLEACAACRADYEDLLPVRYWLSRLAAVGGPADHACCLVTRTIVVR
jgi:anti-sigma factor RsiW